ncbi:MAG: phosphoribosylformylglycinamidine synthase [Acidithiobacillus sp.]|uniref:phosphoribosylformylglycinamidine synthase n=1 Tax=Acidithiobacillus sp. TaxID=1872118 RepID=UPI003D00C1E4
MTPGSLHCYQVLRGPRALSAFRCNTVLRRLRDAGLPIVAVSAQFVHLVQSLGPLSAEEQARLQALLTYDEAFPAPPQGRLAEVCVVPRLGTISPWSTKATEIAHSCSLSSVTRVERGRAWFLQMEAEAGVTLPLEHALDLLHDPMTESILPDWSESHRLFQHPAPRPLQRIPLHRDGMAALQAANARLGLALNEAEMEYLAQIFAGRAEDPSDAEIMMFAQANSEHCRHKVFNAEFVIDGVAREQSLFAMIRETHRLHPRGTLSAYKDNAAVMAAAAPGSYFHAGVDGVYGEAREAGAILMKVETHNHPTAISPFPGAATGSGGEIRDEGATGRGGKPKMGLSGFSVSHLRIPGFVQHWEKNYGRPARIRSSLDILLEGPIGAAAFNNEFGRAATAGYLRVFEADFDQVHWGYHKPIMLAGGLGQIRPSLIHKESLPIGAKILVLGGPAMLIGLGGGAASSQASGSSSEALDFASVQRGNPEMQRRAQEVIERCIAMGQDSPILSIHDVGAGGLANAIPELLHDGGRGGHLQLRLVPNEDPAMSPMEIWCNEAQERYVLAVSPKRLQDFLDLCARERCPVAVLGEATKAQELRVDDNLFANTPIRMDLGALLACPPRMRRETTRRRRQGADLHLGEWTLTAAARAVLQHPTVASKEFLITIGDRSVGGLIARDPMVGPWQVPVADCAVSVADFRSHFGEAMALGERAPVALLDGPASGRLAVAEALTNLFAADVRDLGDVKLSANWMAAVDESGEDAKLFDTVRAVALELCPQLDLSIPVGKDSLSMQTRWTERGQAKQVVAPLSLVISAFAPVGDVRATWTPQLRAEEDTQLWLMELGRGRLGASILAEIRGEVGCTPADLDHPQQLRAALECLRRWRAEGLVLAYHDRSDGGLWATLCEMSFASRLGIRADLPAAADAWAWLFAEEPGFVVQVRRRDGERLRAIAGELGLAAELQAIGEVMCELWELQVRDGDQAILCESAADLLRLWAEPSYRLQALRDDPVSAAEAYAEVAATRPPLFSAGVRSGHSAPRVRVGGRPRAAILREEGVNGQLEMAAAFHRAGFEAVDVHMSDLLAGRLRITDFPLFAACGGFSYGDVLGAGAGWAKSIRFHPELRQQFADFFADSGRLALGVCNGCQMLAQLRDIIPGTEHWPQFRRNRSEQFEARLAMVEVLDSASPFFAGLAGMQAPIVVSHGEGRAEFASGSHPEDLIVLRYVDAHGRPAQHYPANPNGSDGAVTGLCNADGRVTILMPHPERTQRRLNMSWCPDDWPEETPWMELFHNAYRVLA